MEKQFAVIKNKLTVNQEEEEEEKHTAKTNSSAIPDLDPTKDTAQMEGRSAVDTEPRDAT